MISHNIKASGRPMVGYEQHFTDQINRVYNQFAIQVEHPKDLKPILKKMLNATAGLYIKSDGFNLLNNFRDQEAITIHKIPKSLKTLENCCDWMYKTFTPNIDYALASIAADETRIVINSNHSICDGGYFVTLLHDIQDPASDYKFEKKAPIPGDLRKDLLKNEFDEFLKNKSKYSSHWPSYSQKDITYLKIQEDVSLPDHYALVPPRLKIDMNCNELSPYIYDAKTGKVDHMSEILWTGLCMAINAKNGSYGPIGVDSCMDFRRLIKKDEINYSFGNSYTNFVLCVQNPNPKMTIRDICAVFRENFKLVKSNDWFYKEYMFPLIFMREDYQVTSVSNIGPIKFQSPIKDIHMQVTGKEKGLRPYLQATSFSKMKKETNSNTFVLHFRYSPSAVSYKTAKDIFDTYVYFLKHVNPAMKSGDVLDELIHFQKSLE